MAAFIAQPVIPICRRFLLQTELLRFFNAFIGRLARPVAMRGRKRPASALRARYRNNPCLLALIQHQCLGVYRYRFRVRPYFCSSVASSSRYSRMPHRSGCVVSTHFSVMVHTACCMWNSPGAGMVPVVLSHAAQLSTPHVVSVAHSLWPA